MYSCTKADFQDIQPFRAMFLKAFNRQFIYNSFHERGWADVYLLRADNHGVGYGAVCGRERKNRDTIFEFYVTESHLEWATEFYTLLIKTTGVTHVVAQSNDLLLASLLRQSCQNIEKEAILFEDDHETTLKAPGVIFRKRKASDVIFEHTIEPVGSYVLERNGEVLATGGFLLHYNFAFADLFMEVKAGFHGKGMASYLVQEVKKECYREGRVPAARCNEPNVASQRALLKAGLRECGRVLRGVIKAS
jgi:GNAT superfamily N-acetyltransferase